MTSETGSEKVTKLCPVLLACSPLEPSHHGVRGPKPQRGHGQRHWPIALAEAPADSQPQLRDVCEEVFKVIAALATLHEMLQVRTSDPELWDIVIKCCLKPLGVRSDFLSKEH